MISFVPVDALSDVAEYEYAATAAPGSRFVFLAGACPLNEDGTTAAPGDFAGQARKALENLETALAASGCTLQDVIRTRVLVASSEQADLVTAWQVVRDTFGEPNPPSTLLGVAALGYDNQLVEVEAVAVIRPEPTTEQLAAQPAGYWTGRAHEAIIQHIDAAQARFGTPQQTWMTLNLLARDGGELSRTALADRIRPFATAGTDSLIGTLAEQGWIDEHDGTIRLTEAGHTVRTRVENELPAIRARLHAGISDAEYAQAISVLRRMITNAGGDASLP
ncbi:Rid family hydrolase [Amycolatopsis suaedae]|uniref:RidA family protein n=1 Tax=Amycolatopsis suaedae TaxID=2510978 RepID=A0A4V2ELL0_9PSEU|nr:Rid family hydrolase [Amycolatopsis suaedae]RZQ61935.1 hypothetical protein EWH70_20185 [Amycolatopsis suaedae]